MKKVIQFLLSFCLLFFSGALLYSLFVSTTFSRIIGDIKLLVVCVTQVLLFASGLFGMCKQRVISLLAIILLLLIELLFIGYVLKGIAESMNALVK